jgi:hypothetical protein
LLWPGFGTAHPDESLPKSFTGQRLEYTLSQVLPLLTIILVGVVFYLIGSYQLRKADAELTR